MFQLFLPLTKGYCALSGACEPDSALLQKGGGEYLP